MHRKLLVLALAGALATSAISGTARATSSETNTRFTQVGCGSDRLGGISIERPASWTTITHTHHRCAWVAPDGDARLELLHARVPVATSREARRSGNGTYTELAFRATELPPDGDWKLWRYAYTPGAERRRYVVLAWGTSRLVFVRQADAVRSHRSALHHARETLFIAG